MLRFLLDIVAFILIYIFPPYISAVVLFVLMFFFADYMEGVVFAYFIDVIYGGGKVFGLNYPYIFTTIFVVLFLISLKLKTVLKFYSRGKVL